MSILHQLDLCLTGSVICNVRRAVAQENVFRCVVSLPAPLTECLIDKTAVLGELGDIPRILFSSDELLRIAQALRFLPLGIEVAWIAAGPWDAEIVTSTGEIKSKLAPAEARRWSEQSRRFEAALAAPRLPLHTGIEIVEEWATLIRWYLEAMGEYRYIPCPLGKFPTPTQLVTLTPSQRNDRELGDEATRKFEETVATMRKFIASHGVGAKPSALIKAARINNQIARKALRTLQESREYKGFPNDEIDFPEP